MQQTRLETSIPQVPPLDLTQPGGDAAELRAEILRLRQVNHRLMTRSAPATTEDGKLAAELQTKLTLLEEERRRQIEHRAHIQEWWQQIQIAKARVEQSWTALRQEGAALVERERRVAALERGGTGRHLELAHRMADLAGRLDRLVDNDWVPAFEPPSHHGAKLAGNEPSTDIASPEPQVTGRRARENASTESDPREQERFDRFFSEDIEAEPSRRWMLDGS